MKKKLLLIPSLAFILCGCSLEDLMFWKKTDEQGQKDNDKPEGDTDKPSDTDPSGDVEVPPDDLDDESPIYYMTFKEPYITAKVDIKNTDTPLLDIFYNDGYNFDNVDANYTWTIKDPSIAEVDEHGKVKGLSKGKTLLTLSVDISNAKAYVPVYIINNDSDIQTKWKKMGSGDQIEEKDTIIIACPQEGAVATDTVDDRKLVGSKNVSFNVDNSEINSPGDAAQFCVYSDDRSDNGYIFEVPGRENGSFLATTNEKKVTFLKTPKKGNNVWSVDYDNKQNCWDMRPAGTNIDGWFMYNKDINGFANYQSNETQFMIVVSLYKLVYTINI